MNNLIKDARRLFTPRASSLSGSTAYNWSLTGNSGTTAGTNFLGTTDAVDFIIKTAGAMSIHFDNTYGYSKFGDDVASVDGGAVAVGDYTSVFNIVHQNNNGKDMMSLWCNLLGTGTLFLEEGGIGMQMVNKNGTLVQADIHIFANGPYSDKIRFDANSAAINFAGTAGLIKVTGVGGWLKLQGANGTFDIAGEDGQDIRIGTDGNGTNGKGFYLKAYSGANWRTGIKYLNTSGSEPILELLPVAGSLKIKGNTGATGSFTTADAKTVTVTDGIITAIV